MRAILLLLLLLSIIALVSMQGSDVEAYWQNRWPHISRAVGEGRLRDAATAAVRSDPSTERDLFNRTPEPRGEVPHRGLRELDQYAPSVRDSSSQDDAAATR